MSAAVWSAIAASAAAISSVLIFLTQRGNLKESVRPELVLLDWELSADGNSDSGPEVLHFKKIQNVGRGAAMHIYLNVTNHVDAPTGMISTISIPILAPNEERQINDQIILLWMNAMARGDDGKMLPVNWRSVKKDAEDRMPTVVEQVRRLTGEWKEKLEAWKCGFNGSLQHSH